MFVRVDDDSIKEEINGYAYANKNGDIETVSIEGHYKDIITLKDSEGDEICVYKDDIQKLIKALEAAYNHKE